MHRKNASNKIPNRHHRTPVDAINEERKEETEDGNCDHVIIIIMKNLK
jgi:hypothetical protein